MSFISKIFKKKTEEEGLAKPTVEEFMFLIRVYYQSAIAEKLGITNLNVLSDLALFKRMLKIPTQGGKLGLAEKARARKVLKQDYGLGEIFFKEVDTSIKKNCKSVNDVQGYFYKFQGFTNDLFTLIGTLMKWKAAVPSFLKKALYAVTEKTVHDIVTKSVWKDEATQKTAWNVRKYAESLGYSEQWMTEFVYHVVVLAKKEKRNTKQEKK
ncbi:hypothetical protein [Parabacteroides sp. Marseille-P3160]|uniref:hypothetical protein n=1 Tax=Parabacteroides sp. Marseille-P3160 TaxID=1917887 RepID=UPI0009B96099|nr:hypothetical protein [Parabacteroides sp. Marseille-P3160]